MLGNSQPRGGSDLVVPFEKGTPTICLRLGNVENLILVHHELSITFIGFNVPVISYEIGLWYVVVDQCQPRTRENVEQEEPANYQHLGEP
jgi:hypothetical protein